MPLNMEYALMGLPDFALGDQPHTAKQTEFRPLFDGSGKLEMMSDIIIDTPIVGQPTAGVSTPHAGMSTNILPDTVPEEKPEVILLEEHQEIIDELKKRGEVDLNALREQHQNEVLRQLELFKSGLFEDISKQLENQVAVTLAPLVENCISRNSLDALVKEIRSIAGKEALSSLHLSGSSLLTTAVKEKLSDSHLVIVTEETDDVELVVSLDEKIISTRLKEWRHKIETAIL